MDSVASGDVFEARYRIDGVLGEGGFATVYAATELTNGRAVALKILKAEHGRYDAETRARFEREARILAGLKDPHTVRLLQQGESASGALYMIFEHVPGEDLTTLLARRKQLSADEVIELLKQLMLSLREAHHQGLLHRDIKPDNVRVSEAGGRPTLKLLDFGIARATDSSHPAITKTGALVGTPRYMSPEQLRDQPLTQTSDIYSAGMLGLELLGGEDVLAGNRWSDQFDRLAEDHIIEVTGVGPAATPLLSLLRRMTHTVPERRPPSATAVLAALDDLDSSDGGARRRPQHGTVTEATGLDDGAPSRLPMILGSAAVAASGAALLAMFWPEPVAKPPPLPRAGAHALLTKPSNGPESVPEAPSEPDSGPDLGPMGQCKPPFVGTGLLRESEFSDQRWLTHIPTGFDPSKGAPLVVLMHQLGQSPEDFLRIGGFDRIADEEGFVVIAPGHSALAPWFEIPFNFDQLEMIVASTVEQLCLDPRRVFVVGQGQISLVVSLSCSPWVTGIATHAFPLHHDANACLKTKPYINLSPKLTGHEPFEGGHSCFGRLQYSVSEREKMWRERNGCKDKPRSTFRHDDGMCFTFDCDVPFESCHIDGGHNWPGTPDRGFDVAGCDGPTSEFPAAEQVWRFFESLDPLPDQIEPSSP